jgi:signal transduction histidine kinase
MRAADDAPDGFADDAVDQLRHDLKTPLSTMYARAHLLGRAIRRAPVLSEAQQATMLEAVTAIEVAVREMVTIVDEIKPLSSDGSPDCTEMKR